MKIVWRLFGCAWVLAMALGGGCTQVVSTVDNFQNNRAWAASQQARVVVGGTITDEQGNLLRNVQVTSNYVYLLPTGDDLPRARTIRATRNEPVSETFRFIFSFAQEVHLRFAKEGYQDVTVDLATQPRTDIDDSLGRYPMAAEVIDNQMNIVMERVGAATRATTEPATGPATRKFLR